MGFFDAAHTRNDGYQISHVTGLTDSGYAIGHSLRYNGSATQQGQSAWTYDARAATTTRLGYFDAAHSRDDGYQSSSATFATESGYVAGNSQRFDGTTDIGTSAWLYEVGATTTTRLGYFDAAHTRNDGFQSSTVSFLTESGYAAGVSGRYAGASTSGRDLMDLRRDRPEPA